MRFLFESTLSYIRYNSKVIAVIAFALIVGASLPASFFSVKEGVKEFLKKEITRRFPAFIIEKGQKEFPEILCEEAGKNPSYVMEVRENVLTDFGRAMLLGTEVVEDPVIQFAKTKGRKNLEGTEVIAGSYLAEMWNIKVGDTIRIEGRKFRVAGIVQTGEDIDEMLILDIKKARILAERKGCADRIKVYTSELPEIATNFILRKPETPSSALVRISSSATFLLFVVSGVGGVSALCAVVLSFLSLLMRRREEFGVMKAMGGKIQTVMLFNVPLFVALFTTGFIGGGIVGNISAVLLSYLFLNTLKASFIYSFISSGIFSMISLAIPYMMVVGELRKTYPAQILRGE